MRKRCRNVVNDSREALHALATLMPQVTAYRSLQEMLEIVRRKLGAALAWISVDDESGSPQVVSTGEIACHSFEVTHFLASTLLARHARAWRVICWKEKVGETLFVPLHPGYSQLQSGVLCKIVSHDGACSGYFFLGFTERLNTLSLIKPVAVIVVDKLKDYFAEIIARERMAREMQRVVTQYKILFERAPVLMNSFDKGNRCVLWNAECQKVFGWTMAEINSHPDPLMLFYPDEEVRRRMRASFSDAPLNDMSEWHPLRRDGTPLTVLWSNILLPDRSVLSIGLDITERKKAEQQLAFKATTDDLTGCLNRSTILQELKQRQEAGRPFCVLMFDLDYFKQINDEWGHQVGDAALVHFCDRLRELSPPHAALGRVGGEEFLLLAQGDSKTAVVLCETLRASLLARPLLVGDNALVLSFSSGVVVGRGQRDSSALLMRADKALYDAKRAGRGKTVISGDYL
ncbi:sensor domain-containing diguanylate cyclase [Pseudenterobacter timonensis]|uniref:diguanylate cyclase n=1 Tax=Pseudenterobacter timonensis TaxID=1755099 RepID=A0AAE4DRE9_9ENTR|nr:sensor domain-containing diguanylate cyclase [Pseudenterobacter timonensis]MDR9892513.1 sensor domain-containing diguanylate cyclase [Pseudenterobacter timonensis]